MMLKTCTEQVANVGGKEEKKGKSNVLLYEKQYETGEHPTNNHCSSSDRDRASDYS